MPDGEQIHVRRTEAKLEVISRDEFPASITDIAPLVNEFLDVSDPVEKHLIYVFVDARNGARFCECHIRASKLVPLATTDVPLDPEEQEEYRANRELITSHQAFENMKDDAVGRRSFSNLVLEYLTDYDEEHPLKVIGGQHRYEAIKLALETDVDEYHGVKVYFGLNKEQRYDVQVISNTVIAVSTDLTDRLQETDKGPQLRDWCQDVGLLQPGEDFADRRQRGKMVNVRLARSFILNYYAGKKTDSENFEEIEATPELSKSGTEDVTFENLRRSGSLWADDKLREAGREFSRLIEAQRRAFPSGGKHGDFAEKATNYAVVCGWAFVAGMLHDNPTRLKRHFGLTDKKSGDPLNAGALVKGHHITDGESYRGMGYRTDPKERGRFVELFYLQAEQGKGITTAAVDLAIKQYHSKKSDIEKREARRKFDGLNR
jgi:hypothetical protein